MVLLSADVMGQAAEREAEQLSPPIACDRLELIARCPCLSQGSARTVRNAVTSAQATAAWESTASIPADAEMPEASTTTAS